MSEQRRSLRLVPLVVAAATSLFVIKAFGLITAGKLSLGSTQPAYAQASQHPSTESLPSRGKGDREGSAAEGSATAPRKSWMQEVFDYPEYTGAVAAPGEKSGAAPAPGAKAEPKPAASAAPPAPGEAKTKPGEPKPAGEAKTAGPPGALDPDHPPPSAGERAVLESLNQRRQELEARARELDVRENLLTATEKRVEARLAEIKETEARINATVHKKDEAEAARFKSLVSMYENMKAKDAAKIFDRLDMRILLELASQINPRRMSDILAQMSPEVAERLTGEIATRAGAVEKPAATPDLPKIEGRPNG
ncbi:MAG: flagellar protein FlbB [Bradyrhizobiaceae bacterium]|nr:flagellar protein FlbB [Hyphomicrobiales bacterium]MBV9426469.1 flagellar protein FlbB [Bradyrhizobiaceae bacterium]